MAVKPIGTTALTWGSLLGRGNREPIDATQLNYSYTDLLWELNQRTVSYQIGANNGGSGNYYVGLITAVPYVNEDDKRKDSHYTVDANGNKKLETINMKGPWYVSYKGTDKGRGTAKNKYGFVPDGNPNTYYADRIVLKQEMDYTLDNGFVRKTQLGTYYTGVGHWYDSYTKSKTYANGLECPDGVYFPTTSYAEIFNDYTHNVATGNFSHSEGKQNTVNGEASHAEGYGNTINAIHSHAEGQGNSVSGEYAHAEGYRTNVLSNAGHAEGNTTIVSAVNAHAEGNSTYVHSTAENSHAEGTGSYTKGVNAHAENSSYANGKNSHSGGEATAGGVNSFAHGVKGTLASGVNSIALVSGTASGSNSIAFIGTASGSNSVSIQGTANSTDSVAIGQGSIAKTGQGAMALIKGHATGQQSLATNASSASGTNSVAMNASSASNTQSFAVNNSTSSGINSASTNKGNASGENSISTNISTATGVNSASLNNGNASGEGSVAMNYSKSTGKGSVAIGLNTIASGEYSLAQGHETRANNHDSHAEGYGTNASGDQSHAEGIVTTTNGLTSHAEGQGSTTGTNATAAHAEGSYTIANNESEHAQGKYNVSDTENSGTLFTIGNGTANDKRHNVVGIYHNGDINIEGPNTTNHNTGYFKTTVDGSHTEVVRGNYTQTIGTANKNNTCNITVNGNTTNRFNGTSDTRTTGATYEGYGSTFISSVTGFKSSYAYNNVFNKVNKSSYNYIVESLGTYVSKSISERSDTNVYLSAPKICIHGDTATDGTYVDISSDVSYVYGRRNTYIGQPVHSGTSVTTTIKGNTINENSTTSNKTTNTNNETVTGNSTVNVTGSTNLTTGSLNITSGSTNLDLNKTHIHTTNELCIKSSTNTYFKGATNTYVGKDQEGNKGTNLYLTSTTLGDFTSPSIILNASTKYDENVGNKSLTATGTLNEDITGIVTTTNRNNCNIYTYGNSYTYVHGNITDTAEGERLVVTKGSINIHNLNNSNTYTSGNTYQYTSGNKTDAVGGTITTKANTINENSTTSNKTTNTNNETVKGNSTVNVTGSTNLTTGSLNITSGVTNLDLNETHIHTTNELCIKSSTNAYFKGATNTYLGKDKEGNKGTNFYVTSSTLGDLTSPNISLNASTKYNENVGNKSFTATGTLTEDITGIVTKTNRNNYNVYTYGNSYTYVNGNITDTTEGERLVVTKGSINIHNLNNSNTYTSGNTYQYTSGNKTDTVVGTITINCNTINENSTTSNKTTNTNNETVTGNSTTNVTGSTNLTTGSLNITSGATNLNLNKTHIHVTNELCIKSNTNTYFKGETNTYVGKDQEGNKGTNFYVTSSTLGDLTSPSISLNASTKYDENIGNKSVIAKGTLTEDITGIVTTTNRNNCNIYTYGNSYTYVHGNITDTAEGERLFVTKSNVNVHNLSNSTTSTSGNTYQYTSANKTDAVGGARTNITDGNVSTTNKANVSITTRGVHTESINNERSFTVGKHDSLIVNSGGRTEKITGEKITQVVSGNINAYTDDTHDTRLHTRSTYIETVHTYIGDKTNTYISGNYSVGLGQGIKISSYTNVSTGKYNKDEASYFAVGIGTSDTNRKNAFWISQGTTAGTNGVAYFSNNTYVYGNTYDPSQYPNNKEDKSWSAVVTYNMYRNSYTYLYKTVNDKFNTFGTGTYFTKSIDPFTYTPVSYTLHYTTQTFNNKENSWPIVKHKYVLPQAIPGALENDNSGMAGLMSARDKARLDSIWEGDKQIAGIQISTGSWQVFKNDGSTTYTLANIKHQSNSITNLKVEYGFKVKWSGTWKWTVNNQKNAEECKGAWGTTLPAVNTNSSTYTSPVLSGNESGNWSQICYETIYAAKRGLIISGYPDDYAASSNGSRHLGSIVPASGKDNRSCSVSWATYRLLFYGMCTQAEADGLNIGIMKTKTTKDITKRSWTINYTSDSSHCFFMAYPAAFGNISTIKKNGVEIITSSFLKVGAVNYTNGAGYTQQYYVYRSGVGSAGMSITIS